MLFKKSTISKLVQWEYWPMLMFYIPNIPFALYHAIKAKSLVFYTAVNPSIKNSGIGTESKYEVLQLIPEKYLPKTVFHQANSNEILTLEQIHQKSISYPLIVKPDIGFRGLLVKKIDSENDLVKYLKKYPINFLIQEFLTEKNECGVFYYRFPNSVKGMVTSITLKKFPTVIGDGIHTLKQLVKNDKRLCLYLDLIEKTTPHTLNDIVDNGKQIQLSVIGNHSKGTQFINGTEHISDKLIHSFDVLNQQIEGWYYGRVDIKYNTIEDLENGNFKILELNGILAEPTHIYDASKMNYFKALKTIRSHWKQLYKISQINHNLRKVPYNTTFTFLKDVKNLKKYTNYITKLTKI